jgi:hypothetical protein
VFVEGESLTVLVDRSDPATAHLPGDLLDYFESTVALWLLSYGLALGMVLLSAAVPVGWRAHRLRRILCSYPWRSVDLRWDPRSASLVGLLDGAWIAYSVADPPNGVPQAAGPTSAARPRSRSVLRYRPDPGLHIVRGPHPASPLEPPSPLTWHSEVFAHATFAAQRQRGGRMVISADGSEIAVMRRATERVELFDLSGTRLLELRGSGHNVKVVDCLGMHRGGIDFGYLGRAIVSAAGSAELVAQIRRENRHRSSILGPNGTAVLGEIAYDHRGHTTVTITADVATPLRALVVVASLTSRWQPPAPSE